MLASRQVLGSIARSRAVGGAASSVRRLATVSDSALDKKVIGLPVPSGEPLWAFVAWNLPC
jgi:hypothetical protein